PGRPGRAGEHRAGRADQKARQRAVRARAVAADPEAVADAGRHRDDGQSDEPQREAVLADVVRDAEVLDPRALLRELQAAVREVEACRLLDPDADLEQRDEHGEQAGRVTRQRQRPHDERGADRQPDQERRERRDRHRTARKTTARIAVPRPRKSTYVRSRPVCSRRTARPASNAVSPRSGPVASTTGSSKSRRTHAAKTEAGW